MSTVMNPAKSNAPPIAADNRSPEYKQWLAGKKPVAPAPVAAPAPAPAPAPAEEAAPAETAAPATAATAAVEPPQA